MLADVQATFGDCFDKLDDRFAKHDGRLETIADRLLGVEKKVSGIADTSTPTVAPKAPDRLSA
jgi:hypothetical protein